MATKIHKFGTPYSEESPYPPPRSQRLDWEKLVVTENISGELLYNGDPRQEHLIDQIVNKLAQHLTREIMDYTKTLVREDPMTMQTQVALEIYVAHPEGKKPSGITTVEEIK